MTRHPTNQDITWFLDLERNNQLDLDPPYQRRSVWTRKDKQFFLDTLFRGFPSPAIFLHKSISSDGKTIYHVVDGKQRLQTILDFVKDKIRIAKDFGDVRLDGKKWSQLRGEETLKLVFWNYTVSVEMLDIIEGAVVNNVFDRLNRNSRRLTRQELRHAKFEGWFISSVESESERVEWKQLGVVSPARAKRMADSQFISELLLIILEKKIFGFDQDALDEFYAKYDDSEEVEDFSRDDFLAELQHAKAYLLAMERANSSVTQYAGTLTNFYTLWSIVVLECPALPPGRMATQYQRFMKKVERLSDERDLEMFLKTTEGVKFKSAFTYLENTRGASTDLRPRQKRYEVLKKALIG